MSVPTRKIRDGGEVGEREVKNGQGRKEEVGYGWVWGGCKGKVGIGYQRDRHRDQARGGDTLRT